MIEFYVSLNFQFAGDKASDSCLLVLGEQNSAWKKEIKTAYKTDKKQMLVGIANISKDGKVLELEIKAGAAKKGLVRKGLRDWCNKVGLKLNFNGGEPDPDDIDTDDELDEVIEMKESKDNIKAVDFTLINQQAKTLHEQIKKMQDSATSPEEKKKLKMPLYEGLKTFFEMVTPIENLPEKLEAFTKLAQQQYLVLDQEVEAAKFLQYAKMINNLFSSNN